MAQDDEPRAVPEVAVRGALAAYLDGRVTLAEFMDWLMDTCGGRRARTAPELACRIAGLVERHLAAVRADLGALYREASRGGG
jgi:hypothetical protein